MGSSHQQLAWKIHVTHRLHLRMERRATALPSWPLEVYASLFATGDTGCQVPAFVVPGQWRQLIASVLTWQKERHCDCSTLQQMAQIGTEVMAGLLMPQDKPSTTPIT